MMLFLARHAQPNDTDWCLVDCKGAYPKGAGSGLGGHRGTHHEA
jgi:hypothetical protein